MSDLPRARSGQSAMEVAVRAVKKAGEVITTRFQGPREVAYKGRGNLVTDVDRLAEKEILSLLQHEFPGYGILSEESEAVEGDTGYTWVVDPLDGTRNFAQGIPVFSVALALARGEKVVLGVVYDPLRQELFSAEAGKGAFCNASPIAVSQRPSLYLSTIAFDMGYDYDKAKGTLQFLASAWPGMQALRVMGSAALGVAYAACGRVDLYFHHALYPWDFAPGSLLVTEAGGVITDRQGASLPLRPSGLIASSPALHDEFLKLSP